MWPVSASNIGRALFNIGVGQSNCTFLLKLELFLYPSLFLFGVKRFGFLRLAYQSLLDNYKLARAVGQVVGNIAHSELLEGVQEVGHGFNDHELFVCCFCVLRINLYCIIY